MFNKKEKIFRNKYFEKCKKYFKLEKIPKVCYQTWKSKEDIPESVNKLIKKNKKINPDIEFLFFSDKQCSDFIKKNFCNNVYSAYKKINYGVVKADFWRYCILYKKGGIYLDIKSSINIPIFGNIIKEEDICILDKKKNKWESYRIHNILDGTREQFFLCFSKNHPYLKTIIELLTNNIIQKNICIPTGYKKNYPLNYNNTKEKILRFSGPDFYSAAINLSICTNGLLHREIEYKKFATIEGKNKKLHYKNSKHYSEIDKNIIK